MISYSFFILVYLFILNIFFRNLKFLRHNLQNQAHKKINQNSLFQTGGIFFLPIILILIYYYKIDLDIEQNLFSIFLILFFIVGFISDLNSNFHPIKRLLLQIIILLILIYLSKFFVERSGIYILNNLMENFFFKYFFIIFCMVVFINGLNFTDGINLNTTGYLIIILLSVYSISNKINIYNENYLNFLNLLIVSLLVFYISNLFYNNILGDSGVYVLGFVLSVIIINFVNQNLEISPILAINLLWYPAFENLFSIIRKKQNKINAFEPDTNHLHSLVFKYLKLNSNKTDKFNHNFSGILMNLSFIPNMFISIRYYDSPLILFLTTIIYVFFYIFIYICLSRLTYQKIR